MPHQNDNAFGGVGRNVGQKAVTLPASCAVAPGHCIASVLSDARGVWVMEPDQERRQTDNLILCKYHVSKGGSLRCRGSIFLIKTCAHL